MNDRTILVLVLCLCGSGREGEVCCHEMVWGGLRGGHCRSTYRQGEGLVGGDKD
jgi:hypothetical protein